MRRILPLLFLIAYSVLGAESASACICGSDGAKSSDEDVRAGIAKEFNESAAVFSGEVVAVDAFSIEFKVIRSWKGAPAEDITLSTGAKKIDENYYRGPSDCVFSFIAGEKYLVYARRADGGELTAYKCTRTNLLANSGRDMKELNRLNPGAHKAKGPTHVCATAKSNIGMNRTRNKRASHPQT
jgi:hypothetical protein